jgi:methyl-accepting chemotaxis protein
VSIGNRIFLGFTAATILLVLLGLFSLGQIGSVREETETIVQRDLAYVQQINHVRESKLRMQDAAEAAFIETTLRNPDRNAAADARRTWQANADSAAEGLERGIALAGDYAQTALSQDRADSWRQIGQAMSQAKPLLASIRARNEAMFRALDSGDVATATTDRAGLDAARDAFTADLDRAQSAMEQALHAGQQRTRSAYELSRTLVVGGILISVGIAVAVALIIRRSIVGPLGAFMTFVDRVGRGDLTGQTAAASNDEIGKLGVAMNQMVEGLKDLARQSREATENLNAATAEIRASTQEQAASVEEQLAAVQETAATVDEITHSGAQIGKRAQEVIASAQATAQTSSDGLRAVDETAKAMDAIRDQAEAVAENIVALSEKTQAIGDIIATVNDLSERSHLLALNAAIEAAAAGENGRSFAVVASEMKMLADQAKSATGQVRGILGDIQRGINASVMLTEEAVKRVAAGKERTDTTQRTITEITGRVQESVQTFQQIVASTNQQQLGIEQVMGALTNIRQASQQTAAGTRQLDEAAANLASLSQQLLAIAERYRV